MTILAPPVATPAPAPAPDRAAPVPPSWSWRLIGLGLLLVGILVALVVLVLESFGGAFSTFAVAQAQLPASSTAVALSAPVEYRNVTVGSVVSQGRSTPGGLVSVTLHLNRSMLHVIPAGVRATETPVSFFGDNYIVLVAPAHPGTATLGPGATIPALQTGQTASLQATLGDLDTILTELHPAELDAALTALASSLQGNGTSFGHNLVRANNYFRQMIPLWPTVDGQPANSGAGGESIHSFDTRHPPDSGQPDGHGQYDQRPGIGGTPGHRRRGDALGPGRPAAHRDPAALLRPGR